MTAQLFAYLSYRDAPAALDWLAALGFRRSGVSRGQTAR
ncbi:hypothetical protein Gobs01_03647 [Geodermatophilus obscurus DSM 43160]